MISVDKAARRITVSIKALEIAEEKQAVAQYGSSDSGASLGDIFKAAIKKREGAKTTTDDQGIAARDRQLAGAWQDLPRPRRFDAARRPWAHEFLISHAPVGALTWPPKVEHAVSTSTRSAP